jgi:hypothetical protein
MGWLPDIPWNSNNHQLICGLGLGQPIPIILTPLRRDCSRVSWPALKTKNTQAITGSWRSVRRLDDELLVYRGKHPDYPRLIMHLDVFGIYMGSSSKPMSLIFQRDHVRSPSTWTFQRRYLPIPSYTYLDQTCAKPDTVDPSASASSFVAWTIGTSWGTTLPDVAPWAVVTSWVAAADVRKRERSSPGGFRLLNK